jgi:hypothetical protein
MKRKTDKRSGSASTRIKHPASLQRLSRYAALPMLSMLLTYQASAKTASDEVAYLLPPAGLTCAVAATVSLADGMADRARAIARNSGLSAPNADLIVLHATPTSGAGRRVRRIGQPALFLSKGSSATPHHFHTADHRIGS